MNSINSVILNRFMIDDIYGFDSAYMHRQEADDMAGVLSQRHGVPVHVFDRLARKGQWQLWTIFPDGNLVYDEMKK